MTAKPTSMRLSGADVDLLDALAHRYRLSRSQTITLLIQRASKVDLDGPPPDPEPDHAVAIPPHVRNLAEGVAQRARDVRNERCSHWRVLVRDGRRWCATCGANLDG